MSPAYAPWHDQSLSLIAIAAVLCLAGAMATARFFARLTVVRASQRYAWLFLTALASGVTVWCTHFVAMLGYDPGMELSYGWAPTAVSLVVAVAGSALSFVIAGGPKPSRSRILLGGTVLGLSISGMHYLGMSAMKMSDTMTWNWPLVVASVAFSVVGSVAALWFARSGLRQAKNLMGGFFALAVVLLHFTGMSAMGAMHSSGGMTMAMPGAGQADYPLALAIAALSLVTIGAGGLGYVIDSQSRSAAGERYQRLSMYDVVTGLPNRAHLNQQLGAEIERARSRGSKLALVMLDVDGFREINDALGHVAGDEVLRTLGARMDLLARADEGLFVARTGGDDFVVLCRLKDDRALPVRLQELRQTLSGAIDVGTERLVPRMSVGAATFPDDATDAETLLNNADLALFRAKGDPLVDTCFYDPTVDEQTRLRRGLVGDLRGAIERGELFLHYQAQVAASTAEILGYEALLRWRHPQLGMVSPADFIPLAEDSGLIVPIGEWVLRTACVDAIGWEPPYRLSVNLSAVQLAEPELVSMIRGVMVETGLPAERLELEVTETAVFSDRDRALRTLQEIKELGVSIALDDFGVGYSSLDALRTFPFDRIKLDRSFLTGGPPEQTVVLVETVVSLGRAFGMSVLAEGIETDAQHALLSEAGCDEMQGYLFGRPGPLEDINRSAAIARPEIVASP